MKIKAYVEEHWSPATGLIFNVRNKKGLVRHITISKWCKWDIWGWTKNGPALMIRGDARLEKDDCPYIREGAKRLRDLKIALYLDDFEVIA